MYRALEIENEFRDRLVLNAKFFLMDIIDKKMTLGWEEPSEDGCYVITPDEFKDGVLRVKVWVTNTYDEEEYQESRIVSEIHMDKDIYLTLKTDPEFSDDDDYEEEVYIKSLPLDQLVNLVCTLEDYKDETDDWRK